MQLRDYQSRLYADIRSAWAAGAQNVLGVLPTGGGKTVIFSQAIRDEPGASVAIAHRQELVSQISRALNRNDVPHRIIAPKKLIRFIVNRHIDDTGATTYNPVAPCAVAGVDTISARREKLAGWAKTVSLWVVDEFHHCLEGNKWGKAVALFPNARGLGVTATPCRADGKGLGRHADGVIDVMVEGLGYRDLINAGWLSDYRVFCPLSDIKLDDVTLNASGDYDTKKLKIAARRSHIVGDVVTEYLRLAPGLLGVTFATDVETATDIAERYRQAGVPAEVITAETPDKIRAEVTRRFERRELLQLVNVDIFGEGFDLPQLQVVSLARPTESYGLLSQQIGRGLRPKPEPALIIDHVGNVMRHGLVDAPRRWTLDRRERGTRGQLAEGVIPCRTCVGCLGVFERIYKVCPYCGLEVVPLARSGPEYVDGDIVELDAETLAAMRGAVAQVDATQYKVPYGADRKVAAACRKRHVGRQAAQQILRDALAWYGGLQRHHGRDDSEGYRRFYFEHGTDVLSAMALNEREAIKLAERVYKGIGG